MISFPIDLTVDRDRAETNCMLDLADARGASAAQTMSAPNTMRGTFTTDAPCCELEMKEARESDFAVVEGVYLGSILVRHRPCGRPDTGWNPVP